MLEERKNSLNSYSAFHI